MTGCRIVVVSCPRRKPLQEIWLKNTAAVWPDCPFPTTMMSPVPDLGWNRNLIGCLESVPEEFVLLMLDDNYIEAGQSCTVNINRTLSVMSDHSDIAFIKVQAGGAAAPEIEFQWWARIREYDRRPHPFKRTNLVPALYRRSWLLRFSKAVLDSIPPENDIGRNGALEFEMKGTVLTEDRINWPERMMGIHRPGPDGSGGDSLLACIANDAVTGGKVRDMEPLRSMCKGIEGIEAFL